MRLSHYVLTISLLLAGFPPSIAQNRSQSNNAESSQPILTSCEENIALLSTSHEAAGEYGFIIAIARLGTGERRRELNSRRLHNVRVYLTEFDWHRAAKTVITAEGERVTGLGRVELYVGGKLVGVLGIKRNRDLLVGSCEPDDIRPVKAESNLYPYLDRKPPQRSLTKP
jgi:hypothetical protein